MSDPKLNNSQTDSRKIPAESIVAPALSGGKPKRPATGPPDEPVLRVREDDGQPFIRCLGCRYDNHVGAVRCMSCNADLTTSDQRSFNQNLRDRYLQEQAEYKRETERIATEQRRLNREHVQTMQDLNAFQYKQSLRPKRSPWLFRIFRDR
jgi:hypothetical protein